MKLNLAGLNSFIRLFLLAVGLLFFVMTGLTRFVLQALIGGSTAASSNPPSVNSSEANSASPTDPANPNPANSNPANSDPANPSPSPDSTASPFVEASPVLPNPSPSEAPSLQSYQTKFTKLIPEPIRQAPRTDGAEIGRLEIGQEVTVLEESPDGAWRKVQVGSSEGWVRTDSLN
jgi:cytoskeletal protein RodZ